MLTCLAEVANLGLEKVIVTKCTKVIVTQSGLLGLAELGAKLLAHLGFSTVGV